MNWLRPIRRPPVEDGASGGPGPVEPAPEERAAPGIAALFEGLTEDGSHTILDLGSASRPSFDLYARFARRIRFAGVLADPFPDEGFSATLEAMGSPHQPPYDIVVAWNVLDMLDEEHRPRLIERLVHVTVQGARLYVLVDGSGRQSTSPLHFSLLDRNRVRQRPVAPPKPTHPQILPAKVERLLVPFRVTAAFTLRQGWREYVAEKKEGRNR